ncbi:DUF6457 domain-containing protein [Arthrobacter sp. NPDC058288]|uniref:DUF6457 domain-containing protein n=1 Tax=Arthrobacter sp. NPDC058288 TaxID=3346424 RepID=UPI0036EE1032
MKSQDETLEDWCRALLQAFELEDVEVDVNEVLALAGVAAHSVVRPAAPLTTFIAGFAAGMATGSGQAPDAVSMQAALGVARALAVDYAAVDPTAAGQSGSAASEPVRTDHSSGPSTNSGTTSA